MSKNVQILVADDHKLFRTGFIQLINSISGVEVCHESSDGQDVIEYLGNKSPDIITLDLGMPGFPDITILQVIRKINQTTKILVVSMHDEISLIKQTIRQGADGYLTKDSSMQEVASAINRLRHGKNYLSPSVAEQLVFSNYNKESSNALTEREKDILRMIAIEGLSLVQIAKRLDISPKTITSHKGNIMLKLNVTNNAELIKLGQKITR